MLRSLYDYAVRHDLTPPAGFTKSPIKAYISLSASSDYVGITYRDEQPLPCPDIGSANQSKDKCNVIAEKRIVVIPDEETDKSRFFLESLRAAADADPGLGVCVAALENKETRQLVRSKLDEARVKPSDRISFEIDGEPIMRRPAVMAWWREYRKQFQKDNKDKDITRCLITGELTIPAKTLPEIKGIGRDAGEDNPPRLICFDKPAFSSYGLKQGANAPVSEETYSGVKAALDALLAEAPTLAGIKFVHWYDADIQPREDPILACGEFPSYDLGDEAEEDDPAAQAAAESAANRAATMLVESVRTGQRDVQMGKTRYHILLLSGVGGRVMIRRYEEGSYASLKAALDRWNSDLRLTNLSGTQVLPSYKLGARLLQLLKVQKADKKPFERAGKELAGETPAILQSILTGMPLPDSVALRALQTIRSKMNSDEEDGRLSYSLGISCQWLKAWLIRNKQKGDLLMQGYNEQNTSAAYQCGAILAVYECIQDKANPNVNVSVVQRYYASAIQTPALVLGRLSQLSVHHLRDIEKLGKGLRVYFSNLLSGTYARIEGKIPAVLTLEQQAEFALGYYQMTAKLKNTKKEES